jgi:hypothetical protein
MGIETILPFFAFLVAYLVWRVFRHRSDRPAGSPTEPPAPKRDPHQI